MIQGRRGWLVAATVWGGLLLAACGRGVGPAAPSASVPLNFSSTPAGIAVNPLNFSSTPAGIAVNPLTDRVYVIESNSSDVTVIDGATNAAQKVAIGSNVGLNPQIAISPATDKVYIAGGARFLPSIVAGHPVPTIRESGTVLVLNGATNDASTVNVGGAVKALAVDSANGNAYATSSGPQLTVIDGASDATSTVGVGETDGAPVVNPLTHTVYVPTTSGLVAVDGSTGATATVLAGVGTPVLDPAANRMYFSDGSVLTAVDATSYRTVRQVVLGGGYDGGMAVNSKTHKIYILNVNYPNPGSVTIVDGKSFATTRVPVGRSARDLTVDEAGDAAYVVDTDSDDVVRIDGATNRTTATSVSHALGFLAVNPATGKVYVLGGGPKAGPVSGPTNAPPAPYVANVLDFKASLPTAPVDTCNPSPSPGGSVPRGNC